MTIQTDKLHALTLREAAQGIRAGALTAAELTRACLARCSRLEPRILAWEHLAAERAMEQAEERDAVLRAGGAAGPLHGLPLGVKDIIDVADMPTTMGSPVYAGRIAARSAPVVQRVEAAGAVILGKTVTTEFAYYTPNKTRNPWNPAHTPGGSSMGSAAAVAAGMACAALGTQTNGSVIRPAAFCGVVGFKPTHGSIPVDGIMAFAPTLDTVGMFTRSVADAAWLAAALAVQSSAAAPIPAALPGPPRLAAVRSPVWPLSEEAQRRSFESSLTALRGAGASVTELELPDLFSQGHEAHRCIMAREAAEHLGPLTRLHRDRVSARLNALLDEGAGIADKRYREALELRGRLRDALSVFLRRFDAILTPPTPGEAPGTLDETGNPAFCTLWSLVGAPSITIPVQLGPHGLPLGLQIVGALGGDDRLMAVASWCEGACPGTALPD